MPTRRPPLRSTPNSPAPFLTKDRLASLRADAHDSFARRVGGVTYEILDRLTQYQQAARGPILLEVGLLKLWATRYSGIVREAATQYGATLVQALGSQKGLSEEDIRYVKREVGSFMRLRSQGDVLTSFVAKAISGVGEIANQKELETTFQNTLVDIAQAKLLMLPLAKVLKQAIDEYGTKEERRVPEKLPPKKQDLSEYFDSARLTDRQRKCLSLKFEYGLGAAKIASHLGLHHSTVQYHLAVATRKLEQARHRVGKTRKRAKLASES